MPIAAKASAEEQTTADSNAIIQHLHILTGGNRPCQRALRKHSQSQFKGEERAPLAASSPRQPALPHPADKPVLEGNRKSRWHTGDRKSCVIHLGTSERHTQCREAATDVCSIRHSSHAEYLAPPSEIAEMRVLCRSVPAPAVDQRKVCRRRTIAFRRNSGVAVRRAKDALPRTASQPCRSQCATGSALLFLAASVASSRNIAAYFFESLVRRTTD